MLELIAVALVTIGVGVGVLVLTSIFMAYATQADYVDDLYEGDEE
jgi:hypothetical protein